MCFNIPFRFFQVQTGNGVQRGSGMKIAVTGASGKVGRYVVRELLEGGHQVLAVSNALWPGCPAEQAEVDILDYEKVLETLKGCDAVVHLAARPSPGNDDNPLVFRSNLAGTYHVVLAAGILGIRRVAVASSDCTLGFTWNHQVPVPLYLPVDEAHPAAPDNGYGLSKLLSERACHALAQRFKGMSVASLRISYVCEPSEYERGSRFMGWTENPGEGPWNLWSYIDARDSARAFRMAVETDLGGHEVFCIAADNSRVKLPSLELINRYYPDTVIKKPFTANESLEDNTKARRLLRFTPRFRWDGC